MKNTNHTPGPWSHVYGAIMANGEMICEIPNPHWPNAHLIASAPDLLSALQEAYNAIAWDIPGGNLSDADSEALLDTIRAAIAKAKGEA